MPVIGTINFNVPANTEAWIDSGLTLQPGQTVYIDTTGTVNWDGGDGVIAYPEGVYDSRNPSPNHAFDEGAVIGYGVDNVASSNDFVVVNTKPLSVAMVMREVGVVPTVAKGAVSDAYWTQRETEFLNARQNPLRLWFIFNDVPGGYADNSGTFAVTLQQVAPDPLPEDNPDETSPCDHSKGRYIEPVMLKELAKPTAEYVFAWAIEPAGREAEGYTNADYDFDFPAVLDDKGVEMVPALAYLSEGSVAPSEVPINTGMSDDTVDIQRGLGLNSIMRDRLDSEAYRDAVVTIMLVVPSVPVNPVIIFSGKVGKGTLDEVSAKFELHPWSRILARPMLRVITPHCDCELFARGRCAGNGEDPAAPQITDPGRTETGTVTAVTDAATFTISVSGKGADWATFGRLYFSGDNPGSNEGVQPRPVKKYYDDGRVILHNELPFTPEVGDTITIEEGCDRSWEACKAKQNTNNFQGFPFVPGRQDLVKRYAR